MIIAVAQDINGKIFVGQPRKDRHHNLIHRLVVELKIRPIGGIQGFVDHTGKFYNRVDAGKHALECGQVVKNHANIWHAFNPRLGLFSEDLW